MDMNQHPDLKVELLPDGDLWIECRCGAADHKSKLDRKGCDKGKLNHRAACKTRQQYSEQGHSAVTADGAELRRFAQNVRKYSLTKGRDADVVEAVRLGLLSENDAMNADD